MMTPLTIRRAGLWLLSLAVCLTGCASTPPPATVDPNTPASVPVEQTTANPLAIDDPLASLNRRIYRFNALTDRYVLLPAVHIYDTVAPAPVRDGIGNFFSNLGEINTFANSVLQLKAKAAGVTASRFVINSTVGLAGFFDPATHLGLSQRNEDFGQTLGHYGAGTGPYLVLPFFGPSNVRDAGGIAADQGLFYLIDPLQINGNLPASVAYNTFFALNKREQTSFRYYQTGAPFEYLLVRMVYLNYRALQVAQ